jgi:DNA anti-recombination protein RmuC
MGIDEQYEAYLSKEALEEVKALRAQLATITNDRDGWKGQYEVVMKDHQYIVAKMEAQLAAMTESKERWHKLARNAESSMIDVTKERDDLKAQVEKWETEYMKSNARVCDLDTVIRRALNVGQVVGDSKNSLRAALEGKP